MSLDEIHYQHLNTEVASRSTLIEQKFDLFIKLFSAVVAGSVWLSLQSDLSASQRAAYAIVSNFLVWWLAAMGVIMVSAHYEAWRGYRRAQSQHGPHSLAGEPKVPPPTFPMGLMTILPMIATMAAAAIGFTVYNPMAIVRAPQSSAVAPGSPQPSPVAIRQRPGVEQPADKN